jgi:hypothetical protein
MTSTEVFRGNLLEKTLVVAKQKVLLNNKIITEVLQLSNPKRNHPRC